MKRPSVRSVAYDFGTAGLSGLSTGAWYSQGWGAINPSTNLAIPDRRELDLWIQYRPTEGPLKGFRLKTQYSNLWQQGNVRESSAGISFHRRLYRSVPPASVEVK